ncbi:MAG: low molecular weight phosphotyrosine protein phosphatase [Reichenbachiella sp.]
MKKVLFVCLGNICRSPLAEAIFNHKTRNLEMHSDSAGTAAYHIGSSPDDRSIKVAKEHGIPINHKARQFQSTDFQEFDYVIAMDQNNYQDMFDIATHEVDNLFLLRDFDKLSDGQKNVPDPYYGGYEGFKNIYEIIDRSIDRLIVKIDNDSK